MIREPTTDPAIRIIQRRSQEPFPHHHVTSVAVTAVALALAIACGLLSGVFLEHYPQKNLHALRDFVTNGGVLPSDSDGGQSVGEGLRRSPRCCTENP
jgi:hypothetical protein